MSEQKAGSTVVGHVDFRPHGNDPPQLASTEPREINVAGMIANLEHMAPIVIPDDHPDLRAKRNAVLFLCKHFMMHLGNGTLLRMPPDLMKLLEDLQPKDPRVLNDIGVSLIKSCQYSGNRTYLELAIHNFQRALQLWPNSPLLFNSLGVAFSTRFGQYGDISDIDRAIAHHTHAVQHTRDEYPDKPDFLSNLGATFRMRFHRLGELKDINQAILNNEYAIRLIPEGHIRKPVVLSDLGDSFLLRFECLGEVADITQAILNHERAVELTPDGRQEKADMLSGIGTSLMKRFNRLGNTTDVEQAVLIYERVVQLTPDGHLKKPNWLSNLGSALSARFNRLGDTADIERAILNHKRAEQLTPDEHPSKAITLSSYGNALLRRFQLLGEIEDIDRAVLHHKQALQLTPDGCQEMSIRLHNLANSLDARAMRLIDVTDFPQAVLYRHRAAQLVPDGHPMKARCFRTIGDSFTTLFGINGHVVDIDRAILNHKRAIQLMPDDDSDKAGYFNSFGNALASRFAGLGETEDIEQAILNFQCAVNLSPSDDPVTSIYLNNLGASFSKRFKSIGDTEDLVNAILAYRTSANSATGSLGYRLIAAKEWSELARLDVDRRIYDSSVLAAYCVAFQVLPRLAWHGLSIDSRYRRLRTAGSLACDAGAASISAKDLPQALEWLEEGRSIIWGQILRLRTSVEDLRVSHPALGAELMKVAVELERGSAENVSAIGESSGASEETAQKHRRLARDWERLVEEVRKNPGFERFLLPKLYSELRYAAFDGAVVVLNVSKFGCDALIIKSVSGPLHHIRLHDFSYERARKLQQTLYNILSHDSLRERYGERHGGVVLADNFGADDAFRPLLAELWSGVVKPVLDCLGYFQTNPGMNKDILRLRWCPTGPLSFLPIHAAGLYNVDGTASISLPDIAISSYTPTLTTLINKFQLPGTHESEFKMLGVIQPNTPGSACPLPGTVDELKNIQKYTSLSSLHVLEGSQATITEVSSRMDECSWVHLACHGVQDESHPMESGLLLHDGRLKLSEIIKKRLVHAEFAFLSACQTATGDTDRPEEAIHLAAGMLVAGYRGVVGTMWSIRDNDAPFVADKLYSRLLVGGRPDISKAAEALHFSVRELRERNGYRNFSSWVPFIYMGV